MALTDLQIGQQSIQALYEAVCTNPLDTANAMFEQTFTWVKTADDTNATDATAEFVLGWVPRRAKLVAANYTLNGSTVVAQATTTYATVNVRARNGPTTGSPGLTLCSQTTSLVTSGGTGNWAQWIPISFSISQVDVNNAVVAAGGALTLSIAKASTGTVIGAGTFTARIQYF